VPNSDNEQFEAYLRRFRPVAPELKVIAKARHRSLRLFPPVAWVAASAAILIVGIIVVSHTRTSRVADHRIGDVVSVDRRPPLEPLTVETANSWLATAPSFDAALDALAFEAKSNPIPVNKLSAIAVLSEEKRKL
jgi:hypothetical protein